LDLKAEIFTASSKWVIFYTSLIFLILKGKLLKGSGYYICIVQYFAISDLSKYPCKKCFVYISKRFAIIHGSVEAILSLTKISTKTETGDEWGMMWGVPNNSFWNPARFFPPQSISKTKIYNEFFWNGRFGSGKRLCIILYMVLGVDKFNVDYIWSVVCFISSIRSLAILILLNKVIHTVLLYGSFSKPVILKLCAVAQYCAARKLKMCQKISTQQRFFPIFCSFGLSKN
jgi:hypothetical protein